jgi:excisionase family DNA binding protein
MNRALEGQPERLLTVAEVADLLGTSERFPRRLIAERRIEFVHIGRHVRIRESVLAAFISAGSVGPIGDSGTWQNWRGVA